MSVLLRARGLTVAYDGRRVLDRVDVELETGQGYALTGRSGSGKTTLMLVLAGLAAPSSGDVQGPSDPREVLYVPQAPSLVPELTALQNTTLALRLRGLDPAEAHRRALAELEAFLLLDEADALPGHLSGGMQQRVALARATVVAPALLLADEPTGSLDRETGRHVLDQVLDLSRRRGTTLVVATHDPEVAARLPHQLALVQGAVAA